MPALFSRLSRNVRGALFLILGISVFSCQDLILKLLSGNYPLHEAMVVRSLAAIPCLLIIAHYDGGLARLRTRRWPKLMARGLMNFGAYTSYYLALAALPIATTMTLYFTAPLFIVLLSILFLNERVTPRRWLSLVLGFAGVLVIVRPGGAGFDWAMLLPVAAGIFYALVQIITGRMGMADSAPAMSFYSNLVFLLGALVLAAIFGTGTHDGGGNPSLSFLVRGWIMPTPVDLLGMMACGAIAAVGLTLLTRAYQTGEANFVAPFEYTMLLWGLIWDWLFWHHWPDATAWVGIAILVLAGSLLLARTQSPIQEPAE